MSNKKTESGVKKTKYTQRYKPEWERLPEFQRWLKPSDKGIEHAFCKICAMHFNISSSGRTYLSRHMNCSKHIQLTKILYDSSNHDLNYPVKMESIPIRKYTRKPKVAKKPAETPPPLMPKEEYVVTNDNRVIVVNYDVGGTVEDPVLIPIPSDKDCGSSPKKHGSVVTVPNNVGKALYKVEWEDEDEFQDWIEPDPDNICNAICRICKETFTANRKTLKNHAKSIIHRRMLNLNNISKDSVNKSNISNDNDQLSSPVQPNLPNQKTIFISSDTGDQIEIEPREVESQKSSPVKTPVVTSSSSTKRKFAKLRDNFDIDKKFEPKLNINKLSAKTCSHGCMEHRGIANYYQKAYGYCCLTFDVLMPRFHRPVVNIASVVREEDPEELNDPLTDSKETLDLNISKGNIRKRRTHGKQKYRVVWEREPDFKGWLHRDPTDDYKAICIACNRIITAEKTVIKNHSTGHKHKRMALLYNASLAQNSSNTFDKKSSILDCDSSLNVYHINDSHGEAAHNADSNDSLVENAHNAGDLRLMSSLTADEPSHQTIVISTSTDRPNIDKAEEAEIKLSKLLTELGIDKQNAFKLNHIIKQCFPDSEIAQNVNLNFTESNMSRRVPLNCRDPFFRDLDRDFFGESNRQNWSESTPTKLFDQHFATGLWPDEVPTGTSSMYIRSRRTPREKSGFSIINSPKDKFTVLLEVPHFLPDELKVRVTGSVLEVEGKHGERQDDHGAISRQFNRKYNLPEDVMVDYISSSLSAEGVLTIEAPKKPLEPTRPAEREVPIQKMGPAK